MNIHFKRGVGGCIYFEMRICHPSSSSHFLSASGRESSAHSGFLGFFLVLHFKLILVINTQNRRPKLDGLIFYESSFKTWSMEMGVGKNLNCRHPATKIMAEREASLTKGRAHLPVWLQGARPHFCSIQKMSCYRIL